MGKRSRNSKDIFCDVCEIKINVNSWESHANGKRHIEQLDKQTRIAECSRRSLFVVGFPTNTTKGELAEYFSKFANVSDVFIDKKSNNYAIVELADVAGADRIFCLSHKFNNKWLKVKRRSAKPKPSEKKNTTKNISNSQHKINIKEIIQQLVSSDNVDAQFSTLVSVACVTELETNEKLEICKKIENLLKDFFPHCQAILYGSNVSFLGMIGCDVDVFLDLKIDIKFSDKLNEDDEKTLALLKTALKEYKGSSQSDFMAEVETLDAKSIVELLGIIIRKYFEGSNRVFAIKSSRCPIVKFFIDKSNYQCDLSIKNGLSVHNTLLIASYCKYDHRVHKVLFAIRVWAKQLNLVNSPCGRFSNYAITILGLFYLQNCQPPAIPTVDELQSLAEAPVYCFGWECQFCMDYSKIPPSANTQSVEELFTGFFHYFSEISMTDNVASLRTGKLIPKEDFLEHMQNDERLSDFRIKTLNIQDPFELNFNLTSNLAEHAVALFIEAVTTTRTLSSNSETWKKKSGTELWGLAKIFLVDDDSSLSSRIEMKKMFHTAEMQVEVSIENSNNDAVEPNNGQSQLEMQDDIVQREKTVSDDGKNVSSDAEVQNEAAVELNAALSQPTDGKQRPVPLMSIKLPLLPPPLPLMPPSSPSTNRSPRFHPYDAPNRGFSRLLPALPSHNCFPPYLSPPKYDSQPQMQTLNSGNNCQRVMPSKPKTSQIKAITKTFQIVTCSRFGTCPCHPPVVPQPAEVLESAGVQQPQPLITPSSFWTYDVMYKILSQALKFDCERLTEISEETLGERTPSLILCKAFYNTWVDRKAARTAVPLNDSEPIVSEGEVSDLLIKKFPPLSGDPLFICQCFLLCTDNHDETTLDVKLELITTMNKEFVNFATFLKSFSQKMYKKLATLSNKNSLL